MAPFARKIRLFPAIRSARGAWVAAMGAVLASASLPACRAYVESRALVRAQAYEQPYRPVAIQYDDTDPICLGTFEGTLAPYGTWIDDEEVGYVWVPEPAIVGVGFVPYLSAGHWSYTEHGYFWVSDHSWGWVTFHYGRWVHSARWGWAWVPGARYSPAWVDWRYGGGYLGWAPARPTFHWRAGVAYYVEAPPAPFVFVHASAFFSPYLTVVVAPPAHHDALMSSTTRWIAPPADPYAGAHPFVGPAPAVAGLPKAEVARASAPVPTHVLPHAVPWGKTTLVPKPTPKPFVEPKMAPKPEALPPPVTPKPPVVTPKPKEKEIVPLPPPPTKAAPTVPAKPKTKPVPTPIKPKPKPFS